jgi:hypothetical protein
VEDEFKSQNPYKERRDFFSDLDFFLTSCTIDSGPKISGGRIQVSESIQRKKGLLFRPGFFSSLPAL